MDFGISFWTFGTGNDANLFLTNTFLSPIVINPSAHQDYSLSFANGTDTLLFSGNKINDSLSHHVCLNFSNTGLSSYIDSEKCFQNILAGDNTGNYGFTGIISLFSGFNGYSVNDLIILNRTFEDSEISGIYNRNIWDFYNDNNYIYDFSDIPIKNRGKEITQISNPITGLMTGRNEDYFSYHYYSYLNSNTKIINDVALDSNNGISILDCFAYFSNNGMGYFYQNETDNGHFWFGMSGENLYCEILTGNLKLSAISLSKIPKSGWDYVGCSCDSDNIDMFLNGRQIESLYTNKNSVRFVSSSSGYSIIGAGISHYNDEIIFI